MKTVRVLIAAGVALALAQTPSAGAPDERPVDRFTANALNIGGDAGPPATLVQIDIDRWSTEDEHNRLADPLATNQQSAASTVLRNLPRVGMIRALDLAGDPLYFARRTVAADKREYIMLIASRPMRSFELWLKPNMSSYPFSVVELNVDATGNGSGTLALAATLTGAREQPIKAVPDRFVQAVLLTKVKRER